MMHSTQGPRIATMDDDERAARIAEYKQLLNLREGMYGAKRSEVLHTAIDALTQLKEW